MSMYDWAENECRLACKRENPNFDFDDKKAWDYGCSCYKSALKAYKSLMGDKHSGGSFGFTRDILIRLMDGQPLSPITDEDFMTTPLGHKTYPLEPEEYLQKRGLKSELQCPRMSSLFRIETLDGKVSYHDNDRAYYINVEEPSDTYHSWAGFLDEMFPITMPYMPKKGKYKIYAQTFLTDKKKGDFDTKGILYMITPEGERVDINIFETEGDNGKWRRITKEEYQALLKKRIDTIAKKTADHLLWSLISNSSSDDEIKRREDRWNEIPMLERETMREVLENLCVFFEREENWQYNTFNMFQSMCKGEEQYYKDVLELVNIAEYLQSILIKLQ